MASGKKVADISESSIRRLGLSPEAEEALNDIRTALADDYRESFVEMIKAINKQASALDRIQTTLHILAEHIIPTFADSLPAFVRVVGDGEETDIAKAVVVADPIGMGYVLTVTHLAKALGISSTDASIICKGTKLFEDPACAVVVRQGPKSQMVNYHPRAVARLKKLILDPPEHVDNACRTAIARARQKMNNVEA